MTLCCDEQVFNLICFISDLQQKFVNFSPNLCQIHMFAWHDEGHTVNLSDYFVSNDLIEYKKSGTGDEEIKLHHYTEILNKVWQGTAA